MELEREQSGINLTLILPGSTNTRFFDHARSKLVPQLGNGVSSDDEACWFV
jgi:short-subunit dehydrogenase